MPCDTSQKIFTTNLSQKNESQQVSLTNTSIPEESVKLLEQILPTNEYPPEGRTADERYPGFMKLAGK